MTEQPKVSRVTMKSQDTVAGPAYCAADEAHPGHIKRAASSFGPDTAFPPATVFSEIRILTQFSSTLNSDGRTHASRMERNLAIIMENVVTDSEVQCSPRCGSSACAF